MAEGRTRLEWGQTSSVLSLIANVHRDPKKRSTPFAPADFDPFRSRKAKVKGSLKLLKAVFVDGGPIPDVPE